MGKKLTRAQWLERNKALPVALIEKPLKFIRAQTMVTSNDETGRITYSDSQLYKFANVAAKCGKGSYVQAMARDVLNGAV